MLSPREIEALREWSATLTDPINGYLADDIVRRIAKTGKLTGTVEYQLYLAQTLGGDFREIRAKIACRSGRAGHSDRPHGGRQDGVRVRSTRPVGVVHAV
jgi:hypothetical protein